MNHPVFGTIEWQDQFGWWGGKCRVGFFAAYDDLASAALGSGNDNRPPDDGHTRGEFDLHVIAPDGSEPTAEQEKAYRHFLGHPDEYCEAAVGAICNQYRTRWSRWREISGELLAPEIRGPSDLKRLIRLEGLHVLDASGVHPALIGLCFTCSWDVEHGVGVLLSDGKVVEVGENDITWNGPGE